MRNPVLLCFSLCLSFESLHWASDSAFRRRMFISMIVWLLSAPSPSFFFSSSSFRLLDRSPSPSSLLAFSNTFFHFFPHFDSVHVALDSFVLLIGYQSYHLVSLDYHTQSSIFCLLFSYCTFKFFFAFSSGIEFSNDYIKENSKKSYEEISYGKKS